MTYEERVELIAQYRDDLAFWAKWWTSSHYSIKVARALVWAARLLDSGAECVDPDNDDMIDELEMAEAWRPGQPVLIPRRGRRER